MKRKKRQRPRPDRRIIDSSYKEYFKGGQQPDYRKWEVLSYFISDRGKILPRTRTGLDAKKQRRLTREIKRARHLALLPFVVRAL